MKVVPDFPLIVWNGSTLTRPDLLRDQAADHSDADRIIQEVIAIQDYLINVDIPIFWTDGPPDDADGKDGQFAIDYTNTVLYGPKTDGSWGSGTSLGGGTGGVDDPELLALATVVSAADKLPYFTGVGTATVTTFTAQARSLVDDTSFDAMLTTLGGTVFVGTGGVVRATSPVLAGTPTAPTASPGTNTTQLATTAFVKDAVDTAVTGLFDIKGGQDCSGNPNYPAASKGDAYVVTVAGKIGGASGDSVDIGDVLVASADNAGGTKGSVGTSWFIIEHNLVGALLTANALSELTGVAGTARSNLGLGTLAVQNSVSEADIALTDVTTNNANTSNHGFLKKLDNNSAHFINGQGNWVSPAGGGDALTTDPLSQFAPTTSAQLAGVISDETGSSKLVFNTAPTLVSPVITTSPTAAGATWTDLGIVTTADINGGTLDGAIVGGSSAAAGTFTSVTISGGGNLVMTGTIGSTGSRVTKLWAVDITCTNAILGSITGNAGTVTTNANLVGPIASSGNTTSITSQTGTGTTFVMDTSPTLSGVPLAATASPGTNTTQLATTAFVKDAVDTAVTGLFDIKGGQDASANPNYPAASKGDAYVVTVAGKIGGASGSSVDIGDVFVASADNAGGTQGSVGTSWFIIEHNLAGAVLSSSLGTGVLTALGVNVGSAGAFVTLNGALGTPSSGTATNLSGTAASLTAGAATVLATTRALNGVNFNGSAPITVPLPLTWTAVKTTTYSAAAGDAIPADSTSGGFTVTLPAAPADGTLVAIKHVIQGGTNTITYTCGGSDTLNKVSGSTSGTLPLLAQAVLLFYKASNAVWYILVTDTPLAQLDLRFAPIGGGLVNNQTGTTYTYVLTDAGKKITASNASAIIHTIPTNASVAFAIGTEIDVLQIGAGQVTFTPAGGVTMNSYTSLTKLAGQYAGATLVKVDTNTWELVGNIA